MGGDRLAQEPVWDKFFEGAESTELFSIYMHRYRFKDGWDEMKPPSLAKFGPIEVPYVPQGWCALGGVERAIFYEALKDPLNLQFVLMSGDDLPLKPFMYVYSQLVN